MRCFVTGGTGFIGSYVVKSLVEAGIEVVALYHSKSTSRWLDEMLTEEERELLVLEQGDMTDAERIRKLIVDYGCDFQAKPEDKGESDRWSADEYCCVPESSRNM